jgi:hypothetical protein
MVSVTFKGVRQGTCSLCGKENCEVVETEAADFMGDLCKGDLWWLVKFKSKRPERDALNSASSSARADASGNRKS